MCTGAYLFQSRWARRLPSRQEGPMLVAILACLIPLGPLLACLVTLLWGPRLLRDNSHWPAILGCGLSSLCSLALVLCVSSPSLLPKSARTVTIYQFMKIEGELPRPATAAAAASWS